MTKELESKISEIIAGVENMSDDQYLQIIEGMSNFYEYSFNNKLLLAFQGCSQVASFKKWLELGRSVKKGEKAKTIIAPQMKKIKEEQDGEEKEVSVIVGFRAVPVFDISQTEGEEIKRGMTTKADLSIDHVVKVANKIGVEVFFEPLEIDCGGYVNKEGITLNKNLSEVENVGTLIHEIAHFVLGHTDNKELSRQTKEQEAETVTALICKEFGIDRKSEFYLKGWGVKSIIGSMQKLSKAYAEIKKHIEA